MNNPCINCQNYLPFTKTCQRGVESICNVTGDVTHKPVVWYRNTICRGSMYEERRYIPKLTFAI